ncbi:MAG: restriction endonuclease [Alphaproteobacteria bacterium]|nr:restriction endonuclease [Alphaproteobacteria bacterium]
MALGPEPDLEALARGLSPSLLRLFVRDLLSENGFRRFRDFDGPGDGGRDLEAIAPDGQPCVIQLKHRERPDGSTDATEFGELPLALHRLGRTRGLFITNGRLTAPAKRDAASAYPGLTLDFMEGPDLLDALGRAPLTSALWVDGVAIRHMGRVACFGVLCRRAPDDRAISLVTLLDTVPAPSLAGLVREDAATNMTIGRTHFLFSDFSPFRPARGIPLREGRLGGMEVAAVRVAGDWTLDRLDDVQEVIGSHIARRWSATLSPDSQCHVRVSAPLISPTTNNEDTWTRGSRGSAKTFVGRDGGAMLESARLLEDLGPWLPPSWIQSFQEMCGMYRLLHPETNLLCTLTYRSLISRSELGLAIAEREHFDIWWARSISCLVPRRIATDTEGSDDPLAPHFCAPWVDGRFLATWLHPRQQGGFAESLLFGDQRDDGRDPLSETQQESRYMEAVLHLVSEEGWEVVESWRAYHMQCLAQGGEAAPSVAWRTHTTGKLTVFSDEIPSPIDFFGVVPTFSVAYGLEDGARREEALWGLRELDQEGWKIKVEESADRQPGSRKIAFLTGTVDRTLDARTLVLSLWLPRLPRLRLDEALREYGGQADAVLSRFESRCSAVEGRRCSRTWMRERWRVLFPPDEMPEHDQQVLFVHGGGQSEE